MAWRVEMAALWAIAAGLSLAGVIAIATAAPAWADGGIQDRAAAWSKHRADMLAELMRNEAAIVALGGTVRTPPELAVRFDQDSLLRGLAIIQAPAAGIGDIVAKIDVARELDLAEMRTQYAIEAVSTILADVESLKCE